MKRTTALAIQAICALVVIAVGSPPIFLAVIAAIALLTIVRKEPK